MNADKSTALQLKDMLTICLAKAIDTAMLSEAGENWFAAFAKEDADPERNKQPILQQGQSSVYNCDLQALLKFLRYRSYHADTVLAHYGFITFDETFENQTKKQQFSHLLNRLITDFRNRMEAHVSAADIERQSHTALYDYHDAIKDMLRIAEIFSSICDKDGQSYFERMTDIAKEAETQKNTRTLRIEEVTAALETTVTKGELVHGCEALAIPIVTVDGALCITTADFSTDLARLRAHFAIANARRSNQKRNRIVAVLLAVVVLAGVIGAAVWINSLPPSPEKNIYQYNDTITVTENKIDLIPLEIYWDNGVLVAECAIVNGYDTAVSKIVVDDFCLQNTGGIIAKQSFGVIADGKSLACNAYATWTFRFDKDCIFIPNADLTDTLSISCHIPKF